MNAEQTICENRIYVVDTVVDEVEMDMREAEHCLVLVCRDFSPRPQIAFSIPYGL